MKYDSNLNHSGKGGSLLARVRSAVLAEGMSWRRIVSVLSVALIGVLISGATLFGTLRPFGIALIAAGEGFGMSAAALAGSVIGGSVTGRAIPTLVSSGALFLGRIFLSQWLSAAAGEKNGRGTRRPRWDIARCARESIWLRAAFGAAAAMLSGALSMILDSTYGAGAVGAVFLTAAAVPAITLALCTLSVRQLQRTHARDAGICVLLFAAVRALRDAVGIPFGAEVVAAFALSMIAARGLTPRGAPALSDSSRIMSGVLCGVVCGFAVDVGGPPLYAAAALAAGVIYPLSAPGAVCAGWICASAISFAGGGLVGFAAVMPELTVSAALLIPLLHFRIIPAPSLAPAVAESKGAALMAAEIAHDQAEEGVARIRRMAAAFRTLSQAIAGLSRKLSRPSPGELRSVCEKAFDARCSSCENRVLCRERECATHLDTVCRLSAALHRDGKAGAEWIPPALAARCHKMDEILCEIESESARLMCERRRQDRSEVFAEDYQSFAEWLEGTAEEAEAAYTPDAEMSSRLRREMAAMDFYAGGVSVYGTRRRRILARDLDLTRLRLGNDQIRTAFESMLGTPLTEPEYQIDGERVSMVMESAPRLHVTDGSFSRSAGESSTPRSGKRVPPNGDCARCFETEDGRYYMLICDGMGTGGEASVTARMSAAFLEEALCGGAQMSGALTMLNSYLRSRSMECSAGIDLMEIDRYTGEAKFVKSGAAPSFVLREGRLFRLCSKTVPIGILRALDAEMIRFELESGDTVVMLSDGVSENFEDSAWLCDMLATPSLLEYAPEEIAEKIVRAAAGGQGRRDDITAAVVRVA